MSAAIHSCFMPVCDTGIGIAQALLCSMDDILRSLSHSENSGNEARSILSIQVCSMPGRIVI